MKFLILLWCVIGAIAAPSASPSSEFTQSWMPHIQLRAGSPTVLDAQASGTGTVSCRWVQLPDAGTSYTSYLLFDSHTSCTPTVSGAVFGSYRLRVVVTDSEGSISVDRQAGAAAWGTNGAVIYPDSRLDAILGPAVPPHLGPWEWMEAVQYETYQRLIGSTYPTSGGPYYFEPDAATVGGIARQGTVTGAAGSLIYTGSGTNFGQVFCGGSPPCTPSAKQIALWIPLESDTGGYWYLRSVESVQSDTQLTAPAFNFCNPVGGNCTSPRMWGTLGYASDNGSWVSTSGWASNINFYDNALGLYALYYRTGWGAPRDAARWLTDKWCVWSNARVQSRDSALVGCAIRSSIDTDSPSSYSLWPAMRDTIDYFWSIWVEGQVILPYARESAYVIAYLAAQAMLDPNSTEVAAAQTRLDYITDSILSREDIRYPDGSFQEHAILPSRRDSARVLSLTNGSATVTRFSGTAFPSDYCGSFQHAGGTISIAVNGITVTGVGTDFSGATGKILIMRGTKDAAPWSMIATIESVASATSLTIRHPWRGDPSPTISDWAIVGAASDGVTWPTAVKGVISTTSGGANSATPRIVDGDWYWCRFVSGDEITLDRPYTGTSGYKQLLPQHPGSPVQPYIQGILAWSMELAAHAKVADGDPTRAATLRTLRDEVIDYLIAVQDPITKGLPYFSSEPACLPAGKSYACNAQSAEQRDYMAETNGAFAASFRDGHIAQSVLDEWYRLQWARAGYSSPAAGDGSYTQVPENTFIYEKAWGQPWGQGSAHAAAGERAGGPVAAVIQSPLLGFALASVAGAVDVEVTTRLPNGATTTQVCTSSPCTLTGIDVRAGGWQADYCYRNLSGQAIACSTANLLVPR